MCRQSAEGSAIAGGALRQSGDQPGRRTPFAGAAPGRPAADQWRTPQRRHLQAPHRHLQEPDHQHRGGAALQGEIFTSLNVPIGIIK